MLKAHRLADLFPFGEFFRRDIAFDRQAFFVGLEVLADGHDVAGGGAEVTHQVDDLFERFSQARHDAAFGEHRRALRVAEMGGTREKFHRLVVFCIRPDAAVESGDCFRVVVENVGAGDENIVQCVLVSIEIRDKYLDLAAGIHFANFCNRIRPMHRTAVGEIVAVD